MVESPRILLLLDDEQNVLNALTRLLRRDHYQILTTTDGIEGLKLLRLHNIGVIIADQRMPKMSGVEFLREAKHLRPDSIRIILSGYADLQSVTAAINQGETYKFLTKPWDDSLLRSEISEAFQRYELNIKNQQFTKIFENTMEGIMITNASGVIQAVNPAFSLITGYAPEEVIGQQPSLLKSNRHDATFFHHLWNALQQTGQWAGEIWNRRKTGEIYPEWLTITAVRNVLGDISQYVALFNDITQQKQHESQLRYQAYHDSLTDLPNRRSFNEHLHKILKQDNPVLSVLFLDIDRFKHVNDVLGHAFGDLLLQAFAERLRATVEPQHSVFRMGGDEFTLLLALNNSHAIAQLAEQIIAAFQLPLRIADREIFITPSLGISLYPQDGREPEILMKHADVAMFRAKDRGRNNYQFYAPDMNLKAEHRLSLEHGLHRALEREEFLVYYQPKIQIASGKIMGMEALVRWQHPQHGLVSPADFIPLAEDTGFIVQLGEWVLNTACLQNKLWQTMGFLPLQVAVNLSGRQFLQQNLLQMIEHALNRSQLDAQWLELELTESTVMQNPEMVQNTLQILKNKGIHLSIDDFGTGYSSFAYLRRFPIGILKIDQSFVRDICHNEDDAAIVMAIIDMAHRLNLKVVAEGVDSPAQLAFLKQHHCDMLQGYLFSRPIPANEFTQLLEAQNARVLTQPS